MAHEVTDWQRPGCSLAVKTGKLSKRETFSREINEKFGEGGGLNANYRTVEAIAIAANVLGAGGLVYGVDFVFKTSSGFEEISFDFLDENTMKCAMLILAQVQVQ